jgi:hypothetical protein
MCQLFLPFSFIPDPSLFKYPNFTPTPSNTSFLICAVLSSFVLSVLNLRFIFYADCQLIYIYIYIYIYI